MFDITANLLVELVQSINVLLPIVMAMNIVCAMLWGGKD